MDGGRGPTDTGWLSDNLASQPVSVRGTGIPLTGEIYFHPN